MQRCCYDLVYGGLIPEMSRFLLYNPLRPELSEKYKSEDLDPLGMYLYGSICTQSKFFFNSVGALKGSMPYISSKSTEGFPPDPSGEKVRKIS